MDKIKNLSPTSFAGGEEPGVFWPRPEEDREPGEEELLAIEAQEEESAKLTIGNRPGAALPDTGGKGTAAFTIAGITLAVTSGAILTTRRASHKKKDE